MIEKANNFMKLNLLVIFFFLQLLIRENKPTFNLMI